MTKKAFLKSKHILKKIMVATLGVTVCGTIIAHTAVPALAAEKLNPTITYKSE